MSKVARHFMMQDVRTKYNGFIGMTDNEIERILGEPDIRRKEGENTYMDYLIAVTEWEWWIDEYVALKLDEKGRVIQGF